MHPPEAERVQPRHRGDAFDLVGFTGSGEAFRSSQLRSALNRSPRWPAPMTRLSTHSITELFMSPLLRFPP